MNSDISIIIVCHATNDNREAELVKEALASAHGMARIILADNGDNPVEGLAKQYGAKYVRVLESRLLPVARNAALRHCETPFFMTLDADEHLCNIPERSLRIMRENPAVGVVYGGLQLMDERGRGHERKMPTNVNVKADDFLRDNQIFSAAIVRTEAWKSVGGYWPEAWAFEDWDLWGRLARRWQFRCENDAFKRYRIHPDSMINQQFREGKHIEGKRRVINHLMQDRAAYLREQNDWTPLKCSVVMTYRQRKFEPHHERLLMWLDHLRPVAGISEIIVVHQSGEPLPIDDVRVIETGYQGVFNRAWGMNVGARAATTEAISFVDVDDILPPDYLTKDLADLEREWCFIVHGALCPKQILDIDGTGELPREGDPYKILAGAAVLIVAKDGYGPEGHLTIRKMDFEAVHGYDENMCGWGFETSPTTPKTASSASPRRA